jgi:hypothetical protein
VRRLLAREPLTPIVGWLISSRQASLPEPAVSRLGENGALPCPGRAA